MNAAVNGPACLLAAQEMTRAEIAPFLLTGLLVVLGTLLVLALLCSAAGAVFQRVAQLGKAGPPTPRVVSTPEDVDGITPEIVAVISAAVSVAIDQSHRVVHIGRATDDAWVFERRFQHHTSHKVPRREQK